VGTRGGQGVSEVSEEEGGMSAEKKLSVAGPGKIW